VDKTVKVPPSHYFKRLLCHAKACYQVADYTLDEQFTLLGICRNDQLAAIPEILFDSISNFFLAGSDLKTSVSSFSAIEDTVWNTQQVGHFIFIMG
jgi:hypothetical protein